MNFFLMTIFAAPIMIRVVKVHRGQHGINPFSLMRHFVHRALVNPFHVAKPALPKPTGGKQLTMKIQ